MGEYLKVFYLLLYSKAHKTIQIQPLNYSKHREKSKFIFHRMGFV